MKAWKIKNMKLSDILEQFKNIEPDAQFSERSKRQILLSPQVAPLSMRGVFAFLHVIETGAAVALAGFFILILTGSFSPTSSIVPIQYAVIDPQGLHAEAQAIDMQIQLASIDYPQVTSTAALVANPAASASLTKVFAAALGTHVTSTTSSTVAGGATSTSSTAPLSVDQALQKLSQ
jgi:hypothetical protein